MDALKLDAGDYSGTYKLLGGRLALDFVNTLSWPGSDREHDWLSSAENLQRWLRASALPSGTVGKSVDLEAVADLRNSLAAVLRPLAHEEKPARKAVDELNRRIQLANVRRLLDPGTLQWTWKPATDAVETLAPVVLDAADIVAQKDRTRLRYCPSCDWLFEDQTRNGQRRWCDMADCGSRHKAKRYYHRTRENA